MHCGLSRVKNTIEKPLSSEEYTVVTVQEKYYCDERFLSYNKFSEHFMLSVCTIWRNEFLNDKFHSDLFIFLGSSLFFFEGGVYSQHE